MKINVFNVDGETEEANNSLAIILKKAIADLEAEGTLIEDVKLEEVNATFTFKAEGQDDYKVMYVEHDELTELFEVNYDQSEGTLSDNEDLSLFGEEERLLADNAHDKTFPTVDPVIDDEILSYQSEETYGDMKVVQFIRTDTGQEVHRVYQYEKGSTNGRLIQEYSLKE